MPPEKSCHLPLTAYHLHPSILREYDIRGIAGETLREQDAYAIGRAFGSLVAEKEVGPARVCVAYDGRESSPSLQEALCRGLTDCGIEVVQIGIGPTPMLYFAATTLGAAGGIMVTGSHNPPAHNGFKMMLGKGAFYGKDIQRLGVLAKAGNFASGEGHITHHDIRPAYLTALRDALVRECGESKDNGGAGKNEKVLKVAWDAGNGAAGEIMEALCRSLPGTHIALNATIDGTFPAHGPDPTIPANLAQLIETVQREKCDCGIAFDGDGDRIGVVDEEGEIIWGDQLIAFYASEVLAHNPGAEVIADVKASQVLFDEITRLGGKPVMWKTGHSLIKVKMAQTGAPLAGEMSGHIFFADRYYGFDDALYAAVRLLNILAKSDQTLAQWRKSLAVRVNTPELRFACPEERKFAVVEEIKTRLKKTGADFLDVDGVRVSTPDGWWLLRASNTQAMLVARCEAKDKPGLERLRQALSQQLSASGLAIPYS